MGPQVEIETGPAQAGWIYGEATGTRLAITSEPKSEDKSVNQHDHFKNDDWNEFRVVAKGANIKTYINGNLIADLTDEADFRDASQGRDRLASPWYQEGRRAFRSSLA